MGSGENNLCADAFQEQEHVERKASDERSVFPVKKINTVTHSAELEVTTYTTYIHTC